MMKIAPRIVIDERIRSGKPVIEGTRVPVELVLGQLAGGLPVDDVAAEYGLTRDDVFAALAYAAHLVGTEEIRAIG